ncbi:DeoR/GlpR transcriptional regulator [Caproiciproducens sp. NJN-50]|uniref:DeoR/GlpR family DNA-binding transcription regulator n=1 Tax=Acutalibacteraceae TaxID=3082771 RepID=UPI000FFE17D2|nr:MULTISPECIES: DeoR/GlpR family DNA-binding transcription regulator [Acutalibacteraceae]QAT50791.1 DeoR/GlpR transcriptional regulator [Caproiciproducens sp. NJN-50]
MFEEERLQKIAGYVQNKSRASVQELCVLFQVSDSTIRRDLTELENRNLLKRTHGGAVYLQSVGFEPTYSEKEDQFRNEKALIAQRAAELIKDGDSLMIDSGTTTLYLASELSRFKDLTVVTNSILLLQKLSSIKDINIMSTGGILRTNTMALAGPLAEESLNRIRVDKAFIATNGIDMNVGLTTPNVVEASIKQKMMSVADQVYILADHTKIGHISFAKFGSVSEIDACITGNAISENQKIEFEKNNVRLYLVDVNGSGGKSAN